ncbi:MAG: outer membrane lipoprotein LolB [Neisseria sp.]|nr:outer membrane lipoprotein LolB [Neisseria sp.]
MPVTRTQWRGPGEIADFSADGRLAVQAQGKGSYANFDWLRQNGVQTIDINTPLGNTIGRLCRDGQGVLAVNAQGEIFEAGTAAELSERLLGFALPLQYLDIWANGRWTDELPHRITDKGELNQAGWLIDRQIKDDGSVRILTLTGEKLSLRLVFDHIAPPDGSLSDAPSSCPSRTEPA